MKDCGYPEKGTVFFRAPNISVPGPPLLPDLLTLFRRVVGPHPAQNLEDRRKQCIVFLALVFRAYIFLAYVFWTIVFWAVAFWTYVFWA